MRLFFVAFMIGCGGGAAEPTDVPSLAARLDACREAGWEESVLLDYGDFQHVCAMVAAGDLTEENCPGIVEGCENGYGFRSDMGCEPGEPPDLEAPDPMAGCASGLNSFVQVLVALIVAGFIFAVLIGIYRLVVAGRREEITGPTLEELKIEHLDLEDFDEVPDAPHELLLAAAEKAFAAGDLRIAVVLARAAALRKLESQERLTIVRSRTDREYVRAVRKQAPEAANTLGIVMRAVETVRWAGRGISMDEARAALNAVKALGVVLLVLGGLFGATGEAHALNRGKGIGGGAALAEALQAQDIRVTFASETPTPGGATQIFIVDAVEWASTHEEASSQSEGVREWVAAGGWLITTDEVWGSGGRGATTDASPVELADCLTVAPRGWYGVDAFGADGWDPEKDQRVLLWRGDSNDVLAYVESHGSGIIVTIADRYLLRNQAFLLEENRRFWAALFQDLESCGLGTLPDSPRATIYQLFPSLWEMLTAGANWNSPLGNIQVLPAVIQGLILMALIAWWRGVAFGRLKDPDAEDRARFADHAVALGHRLEQSGGAGFAASQVAGLWWTRLGPTGLRMAAERRGLSPDEAKRFAEDVEALAKQGVARGNESEIISQLWRIVQ